MARQWRIQLPGTFYHILSRGNERNPIFYTDSDRQFFLQSLGSLSSRFLINIHTYVLMSNHYHLLIETTCPNLSRAFQWFGTVYSSYLNRSHGRCGHVFQGRFKAFLIQDMPYLVRASYYVHRNPLRARIVPRLADYPWSSYPSYAYGRTRPEWLHTELILSNYPDGDKHLAYRQGVQKYSCEETSLLEDIHHGLFLGNKAYIESIKQIIKIRTPDRERPQQRKVLKNINSTIDKASMMLKVDVDAIIRSQRGRHQNMPERDQIVFLLWNSGLYTNSEIGVAMSLSPSGVTKRIRAARERFERDCGFRKRTTSMYDQLYG